MALIIDIAPPTKALPPIKRRLFPLKLAVGSGLAVILLTALAFLGHGTTITNPVPATVRKAVTFEIYYPRQQKLPSGYSLDTTSFRLAQSGVVIYSMVNHENQRLIFSEEQKPGSSVIDKFTSTSIPLHTDLKTALGHATLGAYGAGQNLRAIVSLPIDKGPWLIITAPPTISNLDLQHIMQALTH